jgi:hypothetical protein
MNIINIAEWIFLTMGVWIIPKMITIIS